MGSQGRAHGEASGELGGDPVADRPDARRFGRGDRRAPSEDSATERRRFFFFVLICYSIWLGFQFKKFGFVVIVWILEFLCGDLVDEFHLDPLVRELAIDGNERRNLKLLGIRVL